MRIDFIKILTLIMLIISTILELIDESQVQEKEYKYTSLSLTALYGIYLLVDMFSGDGIIFSVLPWIQNHWYIVFVYILLAAVIPSMVARIERKKGTFRAEREYAPNNMKFNLLGAASAGAAFLIACLVIGDFW